MPRDDDLDERLEKDWEFIRWAEEWFRRLGWRKEGPLSQEKKGGNEPDEPQEDPKRK
jgi:hypothetical protein